MISLKFKEFWDDNYDSGDDEAHRLYILKNDEGVLYIGISINDCWDRWFSGWGSHLLFNRYGEWYGNSPSGSAIIKNLPESLNWTIELWTIEDCCKFLGREIPDLQPYWYRYRLEGLESEMIHKLKPSLNIRV